MKAVRIHDFGGSYVLTVEDAHDWLEKEHTRGKVVLAVGTL